MGQHGVNLERGHIVTALGEPGSATRAYADARDWLLAHRSEHELAAAEFEWPSISGQFNWAIDWFDVIARDNDQPALTIVEEDGTVDTRSFASIAASSDRLGWWLRERGLAIGQPVILMLDNQVELWESMLAVMKVGAVLLPTTTAVTPTDLNDRVARSGARLLICNARTAKMLSDLPVDLVKVSVGPVEGWHDVREAADTTWRPSPHPGTQVDDPALLYFTSGTTSQPKLVEHTQVSYPVGHLSTMFFIGVQPGDVHLNISSPGWAKHAWSCFFAPWIAGATVLVYNYTRFDAQALLTQLRERQVSSFCAPPTVWRMLIKADLGDKPAALREVVGAGEPLNPEVIEQVQRAWGLVIRDGFGQTETTAQVGNTPGSPIKYGSMGRPLPGVPAVLVDVATGAEVRGAGEGEICLDLRAHPLSLMKGYRDDPERTLEAMQDGFYHTGDVATIDADGYIFYVGRTDDVFKASDYKISPFELESILVEHPAVAEAAIVPAPDELRLAVPKAYVALAPGREPTQEVAEQILAFARERLNPYQRIRRLEFADLPKTISGKIRRIELREREEALTQRPPGEWRDDDFPQLRGPKAEQTT